MSANAVDPPSTPSGAAGGGLTGTYPNPGLAAASIQGGQSFGGTFGDGSDGAATLDGVATVAWATLGGSTYTMTRDCFLTNLTINGAIILAPAGFRIFATGTVTNSGTITAVGGNGLANGTAGAGAGSGTLLSGNAGGTGGTGVGAGGVTTGSRFGIGNSGGGGTGSSGAGGGSAGQRTTVFPHRSPGPVLAGVTAWQGTTVVVSGACGAGSGAGDATNPGGGGGAGGGIIVIFAHTVNNGSGTITANGGNGGTPTLGNCGGGGAGGGGLILVYTLSAWTAGTATVAAGSVGAGVGTGGAGSAGAAGTVLNVVLA